MLEPLISRAFRPDRFPGVRFRIFAQPPVVRGFERSETITLPVLPGEVGVGPSDSRFRTVMPAIPKAPYDPPETMPPYTGPRLPPAVPDRHGHFDALPEHSPDFRAAHVFAVARITLNAWERYLGRGIPWAFHMPQMELIPEVAWSNAHSGYGFIELGHSMKREDGVLIPYWLNFDVIAHEVGHAILFSLLPLPRGSTPNREYRAFHETGSDLIAIVAAMHSDRLLWHVLERTSGDIYGFNEINRLGEVSEIEQVRLACNDYKVPDVIGAEKVHTYSLPVTGALFDILALRYLRELQWRRVVACDLLEELLAVDDVSAAFPRMHRAFVEVYPANRQAFFAALRDARDYLGFLLANSFVRMPSARLSFVSVANAVLNANFALFGGADEAELAEIFLWRGIGSWYAGASNV